MATSNSVNETHGAGLQLRRMARAAGFLVTPQGHISVAEGGVPGAATAAVTRLVALLQAVQHSPDAPPCDLPVDEAASLYGWSEAEQSHAACSRGACYEGELVLAMPGGRQLRFPAPPDPCDYVRVTQAGYELMIWISSEWAESPQDTMRAILGTAMAGSTPAPHA